MFSNTSFAKAKQLAIQELAEASLTPSLDASYLLAEYANISLQELPLKQQELLTQQQLNKFTQALDRRKNGEPIAYIIGHWGFWDHEFITTPNTLIPRPDTEIAISTILNLFSNELPLQVLELGTGSGIISICIAKERPNWHILATDVCPKALDIAKQNAAKIKTPNIQFLQSDWYQQLPSNHYFNLIISNPPYIQSQDLCLKDKALSFEPQQALVAGKTGFEMLDKIINSANQYLAPGGYLMLESGTDQIKSIQVAMQQNRINYLETVKDINQKPRVSIGKLSNIT